MSKYLYTKVTYLCMKMTLLVRAHFSEQFGITFTFFWAIVVCIKIAKVHFIFCLLFCFCFSETHFYARLVGWRTERALARRRGLSFRELGDARRERGRAAAATLRSRVRRTPKQRRRFAMVVGRRQRWRRAAMATTDTAATSRNPRRRRHRTQ